MTNSYMITCCSTADLPASYLTERGIPYSCFHFRMNGMEYDDDLGKSIPIEDFYDNIRQGAMPDVLVKILNGNGLPIEDFYENIRQGAMPTTSQVNPEQYEAMFEPILKEGKDIIHMTLSSGISGTYNSAVIARDEMLERYPDRRIAVIDSCCASAGYGLLVDTAWEMMQAGAEYRELVSWIEENKKRVHHWFFTSDLTHLRRGGRISASAAFFGNMLNICPLLEVNAEGKLIPRDKYRGKKRVIREMVERMKEHAEQGDAYNGKCFLSQSSCPEDAEAVASLVEETFPQLNGKVFIVDIGTVIGSHTGPGTVCLVFWGDGRTV